jgi:hypothetical protein
MLFEVSQSWEPNGDDLTSFVRVLREDTEIVGSLEQLACDIDRSHAAIHPKWLGRVIGGPIFIAGVTQDVNLMQRALDQSEHKGDQFSTASRVIYEYVVSCGEQPVYRLTDPHGNRHSCVQEYAVRSFDEHHKRGVTHVEKHLFAPHRVIQSLTDECRRTLDHTIHTF